MVEGDNPVASEPQGQQTLAQELATKYPDIYQEFSSRIDTFAKVLGQYEAQFETQYRYSPNVPRIIPPEQREEILRKIGEGFAEFILKTREPAIRAAEARQYPTDKSRIAHIATVMGGFRTEMMTPMIIGYAEDTVTQLTETLRMSSSGPAASSAASFWPEIQVERTNPDPFRKLMARPQDQRDIRAVGLLLAARLVPGASSALNSLAKKSMTDAKIITVMGHPVDVANRILTTAGAKPPA